MNVPWLSLLVFLPALAAVALAVAGPRADRWARTATIGVLAAAAGSTGVAIAYAFTGASFAERVPWVPTLGINYILGIDGLSVFMVLLTAIIAAFAVWQSDLDLERPRLYYGLFLILATGLFGVFCSLDLVLFYVFWEVVFIPIYFLIAIWGEPGGQPAALKFLIWMLIGSLVMLLGVIGLYFASAPHTFDMAALAKAALPVDFQRLAFAAFFIGFAVKVPIFPFHVWLPDAYTLAPTPLTALMSASLAAMGVYGFWRIPMTILPAGFKAFSGLVAVLCVVNVIYGDLCATAQRDLKRMTAYSSVSHMGFVLFGAVAANLLGVRGSILHTFNHGIAMAALFFVVKDVSVLAGTRDASRIRHLMVRAPVLTGALWVASLASFGMPGLATFPGELMILVGGFERYPAMALVALVGVLIMAGYIFWVLSRLTLGRPRAAAPTRREPLSNPLASDLGGARVGAGDVAVEPLPIDLGGRRLGAIVMLGVALVVLGFAPILITGPIDATVRLLLARVGG